jgi:hypothetical protein
MQTAGGGDGDDDDAASPAAEANPTPARKETKAQAAKRKKEEEVRGVTLLLRLSADHLIRKPSRRSKPQNNSNVDENNMVRTMI